MKKYSAIFMFTMLVGLAPQQFAFAEDCTGTLPGAPCTIDEDTTAPLTLELGDVLTVGADIEIGHTINGNTDNSQGTIQTNNTGVTVTQTADIGTTFTIDNVVIGDTDQWIVDNARLVTDNSGTDIDLGGVDGGEAIIFNNGGGFTGEISGNAADTVTFGANGLGGTFTGTGEIEAVTLTIQSGTTTLNNSIGTGIALDSITVNDGARLNLGGGATTTTLNMNGTLSIRAGSVVQATNITLDGDAGNFILGVDRAGIAVNGGSINITGGGPVDLSSETVSFDIQSGTDVIANATIANVIQGNGGATTAPTINDTSYLYDFAFTPNVNNLDLNITRRNLTESSDTNNNAQLVNQIMVELAEFGNDEIRAVQENLSEASTREQFNNILESLQPQVNGAELMMARYVAEQSVNSVRDRFHMFNTARIPRVMDMSDRMVMKATTAPYAMMSKKSVDTVSFQRFENQSAQNNATPQDPFTPPAEQLKDNSVTKSERGNYRLASTAQPNADDVNVIPNRASALQKRKLRIIERRRQQYLQDRKDELRESKPLYEERQEERGYQVWAASYGGKGSQDTRSGIDGYDFSTTGFMLGMDSGIRETDLMLGMLFGYAASDSDAKDYNDTNTRLRTYQIGGYGSYFLTENWFLNGLALYGLNDTITLRNNLGGTSERARTEYDFENLTLYSELGRTLTPMRNFFVTPAALMQFSTTTFEDALDEGSTLGVVAKQSSMRAYEIGTQVAMEKSVAMENGVILSPNMRLRYLYDLIGDELAVRSELRNIAEADLANPELILTGSDAQQHTIALDLGMNMEAPSWELEANYNYEVKGDFNNHTGAVNFNYKF